MWLNLKRVATLLIIVSFALPLSKCEYTDKGEQVVDVYYSWDAFLFESGIADLPLVLIAVLPVVLVLLSAMKLPLLHKRILHAVEFVLSLLGMWWLLGVTSVGTPLSGFYVMASGIALYGISAVAQFWRAIRMRGPPPS